VATPPIMKISFEFSPKLGVRELPRLGRDKQSNVPGLYIVGDLADAPIIKVALKQGHEVAQRLAAELGGPGGGDALDVVVIGAGPAGIGAALALKEAGLGFVVLEKARPFQTIQNFPKAKMIFSEPRELQNPGNFWFEDATKEDLVERWGQALDERALPIQQPEEVLEVTEAGDLFEVRTRVGRGGLEAGSEGAAGVGAGEGAENTYRARRVILAIGRRATVQRLEIPGEELSKVAYVLRDPAEHAGRRVLVVGGGDSAVEAAIACAEAGAQVTLSYRKDALSRPKQANKDKLAALAQAGALTLALGTRPAEIREDSVALTRGDQTELVPNDDVLIFIGTKLPRGFLKKLGVKMEGEMDALRAAWILAFAAITWCFYLLKGGATWSEDYGRFVAKKPFFPFGPEHPLGSVPDLLHVDLGFRVIDGAFWGTLTYSLLILIFGIRAYRKYPRRSQKRRYLSLIGFQWIFLFGVPEVVAPLVIKIGGEGGLFWSLFGGDRAWKLYGLSVPWPLNIWALIDAPGWTATGDAGVVITWLVLAALVSFVAIPLFVRRHGERFCSWACGCGGLAETLGDFWRHLAPRGRTAYKAEIFGRIIFFLAIPVTLLILNDAWQFFAAGALYNAKVFAEKWYTLMVDFWLASVVGVALYPYLGNRVWCRFFCPLRAYMEMLSRRIGRIAIDANHKCIGCGECTRFCQMGIDVQSFAQKQQSFHNGNSACIQCGICIQVCPMEVLTIGEREVKLAI
jgi:NosR/NirI family nitrous oxide reductase transcriptional regulator